MTLGTVQRAEAARADDLATDMHDTYNLFVFPRPTFVVHRSAEASLADRHLTIRSAEGEQLFRAPLSELRVGNRRGYFAPIGLPYQVFHSPDGSFIRLGFSRTIWRTALVVLAFFAPFAVSGLLDQDTLSLVPALVVSGLVLAAAEWSIRPGEGPAFYERLRELEPEVFERRPPLLPLATNASGRMWLLVFIGFAILIASALTTALLSQAMFPDAPSPDPDLARTFIRIGTFVLVALAYGWHTWNHVAAHRPWATGDVGNWSTFAGAVVLPMQFIGGVLAVILARQVFGI